MGQWLIRDRRHGAAAAGLFAVLLLATSAMAADRSMQPGTGLESALYAGSWHGTIHLGNSPQAEADRHIFVEFGENGSFNCPTHDLVTLKEGSPSAGWLSWNAEGVEFIMNTAEGEERHAFQFFHVPREERNELAPPKLYLHDVATDIHLHLTPVSLTSPAR